MYSVTLGCFLMGCQLSWYWKWEKKQEISIKTAYFISFFWRACDLTSYENISGGFLSQLLTNLEQISRPGSFQGELWAQDQQGVNLLVSWWQQNPTRMCNLTIWLEPIWNHSHLLACAPPPQRKTRVYYNSGLFFRSSGHQSHRSR